MRAFVYICVALVGLAAAGAHGPLGADEPQRHVPMTNAERSPTFYSFVPSEQLAVWREMDDRDERPVVIYHSHTATER